MCEFEFNILFELEKRLDLSRYGGKVERTLAYIGEILYGTYIAWIQKQQTHRVFERQIAFFENTAVEKHTPPPSPRYKRILKNILPAYRVGLRLERNSHDSHFQIIKLTEEVAKIDREIYSLTQEIAELHRKISSIQNLNLTNFWLTHPSFPEDIDAIKKQFWSSYPTATGDIRLLQKANALLLRRLKEICDSLEIKFWLHGGSLVGGLRHKGCIPWDDDIDVGMMRTDFSKLSAYLKDHPQYEIAEYYYMEWSCRAVRFMRRDIKANFFVDIFLYDYYTCSTESLLSDWIKIRGFKDRMAHQWRLLSNVFGNVSNERLTDRPEYKKQVDNLIDSYIKKFQASGSTRYIYWGIDNIWGNETFYCWRCGKIFSVQDVFPLKTCEYEGEEFYIPANYRKYVFAEYGIDYLELPGDIGYAKHMDFYFQNKDIRERYLQLMEAENEI